MSGSYKIRNLVLCACGRRHHNRSAKACRICRNDEINRKRAERARPLKKEAP